MYFHYLRNYGIKIIFKRQSFTNLVICSTCILGDCQVHIRRICVLLVPGQIFNTSYLSNEAGVRLVIRNQRLMQPIPIWAIPIWLRIKKDWGQHSPRQRSLKHADKQEGTPLVWPKGANLA